MPKRKLRVLELSAGPAPVLHSLHKRHKERPIEYHGVDFDSSNSRAMERIISVRKKAGRFPESIEINWHLFPKGKNPNLEALRSFPDNHFHEIHFHLSWHRPFLLGQGYLAELYRVMAPNGIVYCLEEETGEPKYFNYWRPEKSIGNQGGEIEKRHRGFVEKIQQAGFKIVLIQLFPSLGPQIPYKLEEILGRKLPKKSLAKLIRQFTCLPFNAKFLTILKKPVEKK